MALHPPKRLADKDVRFVQCWQNEAAEICLLNQTKNETGTYDLSICLLISKQLFANNFIH